MTVMKTHFIDEIYKLNALVRDSPGHVYWKDLDLVHEGCNQNLADFLGLKHHTDIKGMNNRQVLAILNSENRLEDIEQNDLQVIEQEKTFEVEESVRDLEGNMTHFLSIKKPLYNMQHQVIGLMGISFDITLQKQFAVQLEIANERAKQNNLLKSELIANLRHDMRTPFAGIHGLLEILQLQETSSEKKHLLQMCLQSIKNLMDYCDLMFESSLKLDQDIPTSMQHFAPMDLVQKVVGIFQPAAQHRQLDLTYTIDDRVPRNLVGPYQGLYRVLTNLIDNGIKFTPSGHVHIHVAGGERLIIDVCDTGPGIPPERRQAIFEKFCKLTPQYHKKTAGFGLGLHFVAKICAANDMRVTVRDNIPSGTIFHIECPVECI